MHTHHHHVLGTTDLAKLARGPATAHGDAELLQLIAEFIRLERAADAIWAAATDLSLEDISDREDTRALYRAQRPLFDRIMTLRATTPAGFRARAEMLFVWDKELKSECEGDDAGWPDRMRWALISDILGEDRS